MRRRALLFAIVLLSSGSVYAQAIWEPTPPPLVTAQNESWYLARSAIEWAGDFYYPIGAAEYFNPYQMAQAGSYRGIPLYTDATRAPYETVFVPIGNALMQPYRRPHTGALAETAEAIVPMFPVGVAAPPDGAAAQVDREAIAPPMLAPSYDAMPGSEPTGQMPVFSPVPTSGSTAALNGAAATIGRSRVAAPELDSVIPPVGVDGIWVNYDGHRWFWSGRAVSAYAGEFTPIG
ncbi:MAG TPA: hypothetical protein VGL62_01370, partial [Vicinamibacterales bacterium]